MCTKNCGCGCNDLLIVVSEKPEKSCGGPSLVGGIIGGIVGAAIGGPAGMVIGAGVGAAAGYTECENDKKVR